MIYLKQISSKEEISISLVYAQAKLRPKKPTTVPRLELCAAVLSTQAVKRVLAELSITIDKVTYYTDSKVVLGYIQNESRRFYVYVANRILIIHGLSEPTQWKFIDTRHNPADLATRGSTFKNLVDNRWFEGLEFLTKPELEKDVIRMDFSVQNEDPELRPEITIHATQLRVRQELNSRKFEHFSSWSSLRRALANLIAVIRLWKRKKIQVMENNPKVCRGQSSIQPESKKGPSLEELKQAESIMIKTAQSEHFANEITISFYCNAQTIKCYNVGGVN